MTDLAQLDAMRATTAARAAADDGSNRGRRWCLECRNAGMVEVDSAGQGTYRPCSRCNPQGFERWRGGHHMPNHSCESCHDLRRTPPR